MRFADVPVGDSFRWNGKVFLKCERKLFYYKKRLFVGRLSDDTKVVPVVLNIEYADTETGNIRGFV